MKKIEKVRQKHVDIAIHYLVIKLQQQDTTQVKKSAHCAGFFKSLL